MRECGTEKAGPKCRDRNLKIRDWRMHDQESKGKQKQWDCRNVKLNKLRNADLCARLSLTVDEIQPTKRRPQ